MNVSISHHNERNNISLEGDIDSVGCTTKAKYIFDDSIYGSSGELLSETDALGRTSKYQYDFLTNTFPTSIINPAGHVTYFSYDLGTGNLLWQEKNSK